MSYFSHLINLLEFETSASKVLISKTKLTAIAFATVEPRPRWPWRGGGLGGTKATAPAHPTGAPQHPLCPAGHPVQASRPLAPALPGEHLDCSGGRGGGAYLRNVKRTVSSLWEATITLALALCFSSSRT